MQLLTTNKQSVLAWPMTSKCPTLKHLAQPVLGKVASYLVGSTHWRHSARRYYHLWSSSAAYYVMVSWVIVSFHYNKHLDAIDATAITSERIQGLKVGDVVEFVDQYGNKGLIKVSNISPGFGSDGSITFDVKVQFSALPIKG